MESINEIKEVIDKKKDDINSLIEERQESIDDYTNQKKKIEKKIPDGVITTFNRIYKNQFHTAVVKVEDQICHGCNMQIPLQTEIDVREEDEMTFCPSCSRILYYNPEEEDEMEI